VIRTNGYALWLFAAGLMAGCLPPVEEVADETPAAAQADAAQSTAAASEPAGETTTSDAAASTPSSSTDMATTPSGLKYKIVRAGDGAKPTANNTVLCHYRGWLDNGTEFDSSYKRGEPTDFPLSDVIKGWTEGLQLIGKGGKIELEVPGDLGYGPRGMPRAGIGPNATLHFEVELIDILQ
jgi:FKBP-type peptidyl-prolyl cis-trans isomerase